MPSKPHLCGGADAHVSRWDQPDLLGGPLSHRCFGRVGSGTGLGVGVLARGAISTAPATAENVALVNRNIGRNTDLQ
jgi:hypothetical protein